MDLWVKAVAIQPAKRFTVGGTISSEDSIYVVRKADEELYTRCIAGDLAYILTGRQMGKSSLMVRTAKRLRANGHDPVVINLEEMGVNATEEEWYYALVDNLTKQLPLKSDGNTWWANQKGHGLTKRFFNFITDIVMAEVSGRVILFIDEIDSTINLPFADDFFALIRSLYNNRYQHPDLERLSIILIGTATPYELIKNPSRTSFNIGMRIDLNNFTLAEAFELTSGFITTPEVGYRILTWIMNWTDGHPYLTQKVCSHVAKTNLEKMTRNEIKQLVFELFISSKAEDSCIAWMEKYLLDRQDQIKIPMLISYRQILLPFINVKADAQSQIHQRLLLSGVVQVKDGYLTKQNPIFYRVFNLNWINRELPWIRLLRQIPQNLRRAGGVFILLWILFLFILGGSSYYIYQSLIRQLESIILERQNTINQLNEASAGIDEIRVEAAVQLLETESELRQTESKLIQAESNLQQKESELDKLTVQLELLTSELESKENDKGNEITQLRREVDRLRITLTLYEQELGSIDR
ncbi:MAG: AAA-like domain-containing protein [Chloroflexota bacterium]